MLRVIIVDDERQAISLIETYIKRLPDMMIVATEANPLVALNIIKEEKPDVVFLDVQMDEMNGIELMELLDKNIAVVLCTAYSEFAVTSYDLEAVDYLLKPITFQRFAKAVQRVKDRLYQKITPNYEAIPHDYIFVKSGQRGIMQKVAFDDIDFIEAMSNYVAFYLDRRKVVAYIGMKELESRLPSSHFIRVHKSYIVAIKQITAIEINEIVFNNRQQRIPIGSNYKEAFLEKMKGRIL